MSDSPATRRRRCAARIGASLLLGIAVDGIVCPQRAFGVTRSWTGGTGTAWRVPTNWSPAGIPVNGDAAIIPSISNFGPTNVTYDFPGTTVTLTELRVSRTANGPYASILSIPANVLNATSENVGDSGVSLAGSGQIIQSGGSNTTTFLYLGVGTPDIGRYTLSAGSLGGAGASEVVGYGGHGTFTQSGGTNNLGDGELVVGLQTGSSGTYTLGALDTLSVAAGNELVGSQGAGTFNQTGGSNFVRILSVGDTAGGTGTYMLSGGVLSVGQSETVGGTGVGTGAGTFLQNGGTHTITGTSGTLAIASGFGSNGAYYLNGGALTATSIYVGGHDTGPGGAGSLTVASGATLTVSGTLKAWNTGIVKLASPTRAGAVTNAGGGKIDLTNSAMVIDSAPAPVDLLDSGYAAGAWNGPGIESSTAALPANLNKTAIGYAEARDLFTNFPASFAGLPVASSSILLRYTHYGDANLDGKVDTLDFDALAPNFGALGKRWSQGDFNYDDGVDSTDLRLLESNFGQVLPAPAPGPFVPEPSLATGGIAVMGSLCLARRRQRPAQAAASDSEASSSCL